MNKEEPGVPSSLVEVWEWKDSIHREVAELPPREALKKILEQAAAAAGELNLKEAAPLANSED